MMHHSEAHCKTRKMMQNSSCYYDEVAWISLVRSPIEWLIASSSRLTCLLREHAMMMASRVASRTISDQHSKRNPRARQASVLIPTTSQRISSLVYADFLRLEVVITLVKEVDSKDGWMFDTASANSKVSRRILYHIVIRINTSAGI
jgi:hypothetical protein